MNKLSKMSSDEPDSQTKKMIISFAEKIDRKTKGLYGDPRRGFLKNPKKIIVPVLIIGAIFMIIVRRRGWQ